jgi:predicted heme/steroid binding protein
VRSCVVPSRSVVMLCSKQTHFTILSVLSVIVSIISFNNRHFALRSTGSNMATALNNKHTRQNAVLTKAV